MVLQHNLVKAGGVKSYSGALFLSSRGPHNSRNATEYDEVVHQGKQKYSRCHFCLQASLAKQLVYLALFKLNNALYPATLCFVKLQHHKTKSYTCYTVYKRFPSRLFVFSLRPVQSRWIPLLYQFKMLLLPISLSTDSYLCYVSMVNGL
jgi:hypothetical protein